MGIRLEKERKAWKDRMEWCEKDAIGWIKQGEDIPQGDGISVLVDWQQQADQIREELAKLVQPRNYTQVATCSSGPHSQCARARQTGAAEQGSTIRFSRNRIAPEEVPQ